MLPAGVHHEYASLDDFLAAGTYEPGLLTIRHRGLPIDILHDPRGFSRTTIYFNAAITNPELTFPFFSGAGISNGLATNRIHIHDPSLYLKGGLKLAWYAGNSKQPQLQSVIARILRALVPPGQHAVTFGSSGGGFAALHYATELPDATAVAVNPQTDIARYNQRIVARYAELAWGVTGDDVVSRIPARMNLVEAYRKHVDNRAWYIQNTGDGSHVREHLNPFVKAAHARNEVSTVLVDAGKGHVPPPKRYISEVLAAAVEGDDVPPTP